MPDTLVALGDIVFQDFEVPERIPFGGAQRLGVHQLPGGVRIVDSMGADDADLTWSGMFMGPNAADRARYLDYLRKQGKQILLTWGAFAYLVVVSTFQGDYERYYQVPYEICCKVVQDLTAPVASPPGPSLDDLVNADLNNVLGSAQSLGMTVPGSLPGPLVPGSTPSNAVLPPSVGSGIDLSAVASSLTTLRSAVSAVSSFTGAQPTQLLPVMGAIAGAQQSVNAALLVSEGSLGSASGIGGVVSGVAGAVNAATFAGYAADAQQAPLLRNMGNFLTRMNTNLSQGAI